MTCPPSPPEPIKKDSAALHHYAGLDPVDSSVAPQRRSRPSYRGRARATTPAPGAVGGKRIRSRWLVKLQKPWASRRVFSMTRLTASVPPYDARHLSREHTTSSPD